MSLPITGAKNRVWDDRGHPPLSVNNNTSSSSNSSLTNGGKRKNRHTKGGGGGGGDCRPSQQRRPQLSRDYGGDVLGLEKEVRT